MPQTTTAGRKAKPSPHAELVGRVRRFGPRGVPYEVLKVVSTEDVLIRVITTGEETAYPIEAVLTDPED